MAAVKRYVYGPVPSRRLGLSLGVDLVPHKVCCHDCLYCQVAPTTALRAVRRRFAPPGEVLRQVAEALRRGPAPEVITLAGSGEPTLHVDLGEIADGLRRVAAAPLVLLTNGALLWDPAVRSAAARFDRVFPSLDAPDEETYRRLNRPAPGLTLARHLQGLSAFCAAYRGELRLEVMLVAGVNDSPPALAALAEHVARLGIRAVDLNTVVRPPAHGCGQLSAEDLQAARRVFSRVCEARVVAPHAPGDAPAAPGGASEAPDDAGRLLQLLARRPCTLADICGALGLPPAAARSLCEAAVREGKLRPTVRGADVYYVPA